jgi:hypothetical protein
VETGKDTSLTLSQSTSPVPAGKLALPADKPDAPATAERSR